VINYPSSQFAVKKWSVPYSPEESHCGAVVGAETSGQKQLLYSASQLAHCLEELMELETEK
jgi:hypothetical protein